MKVVVIHGQSHKGSTYHIAHSLAEKLDTEAIEIFLPKDFNEFCVGCTTCFGESEIKCPHYRKLLPITKAVDAADVLILASPVYVYHATGAMKALLDHYGWRWMVHRPEPSMFAKQAVCISTAAGAGMKTTNRDMADSTFWWGGGENLHLWRCCGGNFMGAGQRKKEGKGGEKVVRTGKKDTKETGGAETRPKN